MNHIQIKKWLREGFELNKETKIRHIDFEKQEFVIYLGDCHTTIDFPIKLKREIKLNKLLPPLKFD